ncbi:MAG: hypothetical protein E4H01_12390 [Lysobacterales bacterium]|nr:MAG: hypothetical protein E4H01_12390 [Xanthomonadales bacterium]
MATRSSVSFLSFFAANVLIDVESLYNMVTHQPRVHTFLHTYVGSTLAAAVIVLAFVPARRLAMKLPRWPVLAWRHLPLKAVALGAMLGAWSHVLLDSIMHSDITPWAPFSEANGRYLLIPVRTLHVACLVAGLVALAWWVLRSVNSLERRRER